ncbi:MAG: SIS domain-containing protein [Elusimicrobiota bacterium]
MKEIIEKLIQDSIDAKKNLLNSNHVEVLEQMAKKILAAYAVGKKVLVCGNGGSASDAQHFVGELVCRFQVNRKPLAAVALNSNVASMTAIANDFSFEDVFARQVEALAQHGDVVIGISTSGKSPNVLKAVAEAKKHGAVTLALCGNAGELKDMVDLAFCAPSKVTARIQECHILAIHILCHLIEERLVAK